MTNSEDLGQTPRSEASDMSPLCQNSETMDANGEKKQDSESKNQQRMYLWVWVLPLSIILVLLLL